MFLSVFDGNKVLHCENNEKHKFWQNPRGNELRRFLHLNKNASETDFTSEKEFEI